MKLRSLIIGVTFIPLLYACTKDVIISNNNAPNYDEVSTILIENYVNRAYIDLIGREPLDSEMVAEVTVLRGNDLSFNSRSAMISKLQTDTSFVFGDSSYRRAYYHRFYNLAKARVIEGASNQEIQSEIGILKFGMKQDSLNGNWAGYEEKKRKVQKFINILRCDHDYEEGLIGVDSIFAFMINNGIYDFINMNTFNFVNASFDNLLYRYPTQSEFNKAYNVVENNQSELIFGQPASNKDEYIEVLVSTDEFYEGMIVWAFQNLVQRNPTSVEVNHHMQSFRTTKNFQEVQRQIAISDEYAGFD